MTKEPKICPFLSMTTYERGNYKPCLKSECALWVQLQKDCPNPFYRYEFEGCGLISHPTWIPKKIEREKGESKTKP